LINGRPVQGLASIVSEYGSTDAGKLAALKLGESYLATGKVDEAKDAFEIATGADEPMFQAAATASLASVAEEKDNHAEAAKLYDKAASLFDSDVARPLYLFAAAKNFELADQQEEAIDRYRKIAVEYPTSEQNNVARFALARYGKEI
jgi:tetratricopeptide (TPR) repeat protein